MYVYYLSVLRSKVHKVVRADDPFSFYLHTQSLYCY
nr:MAG TPA: hypothetical protein [Caudoviricetes sp.]